MGGSIKEINLPYKKVDLLGDSLDHLLTLMFFKSSSPNYHLAVNLAEHSKKYEVTYIAEKPVHMVAFEKNKDGASRGSSLISIVGAWRGTQIYSSGKIMNYFRMKKILDCYLTSLQCKNSEAHCKVAVPSPLDDKINKPIDRKHLNEKINRLLDSKHSEDYLFPCSLLYKRFRYHSEHPASLSDQINASAVKEGCISCPQFEA